MKKLSILLSGVLALAAFTACEDDPEAAAPQKNPQPALFSNADISASLAAPLAEASATEAQPLNLQEYREVGLITLMDNVTVSNIPAGAEVEFDLQLSTDANFAEEQTATLTATTNPEGKATILASDWNQAHYDIAGKSMDPHKFYYRVYGYIALDNTRYMIGEANPTDPSTMVAKEFAKGDYKEIPFELIIAPAYYFVSNCTTWNLGQANSYKFDHKGDDVYANPVFTYKFEVPQDQADDGMYWQIVSQTAIDTQEWDNAKYGPSINGDKSLSGKLIVNGNAGQITEPGRYNISINMEEMTYEIVKLIRPDYIAVPNGANGWNQSGPRLYWSNKDDKPYFCGAAIVDGNFKFIWNDSWYGAGATEGTIDPAGGDIPSLGEGINLYWFTVDTDNMTYTATEVTSLGLIGIKGWTPATDVLEMTPSEDYKTWTIENVQLNDGWKIIINKDWASNYGFNDAGELIFDGGNISGHAGLADVTLSFADHKPVLTITAK